MFGGGGGLNPRKMQQMMKQMGIEFEELDVTEVVVRLEGGEELHFDDPDVNKMEAQGQETYQVVGEPESREAGGEASETGEVAAGDAGSEAGEATGDAGGEIPEADVEIVAQRTGASEEAAREALEETGGDLAAAVEKLE